ncbi:MAG: outer membrane beta-barrel protein [Gemmatimonadota bacterium]
MKRAKTICLGLGSLVCLLLAEPALAQRVQPFAGVSGGATSSRLVGGGFSSDARWGGTAGVFVGARTSRNSVINLEGNWLQQGGGDTRLDYIDVPLTVGAVVPSADRMWRFRGYAGIGLAFKVSCSSDTSFLNCGSAKSTVWSLPFGFMFGRVLQGGKVLALDIRYSLGLSDAFTTSSVDNRSWQFRALFAIPLQGGRGGR